MLNALSQHLYYLLSFKHDGQGLKTDKSFTIILVMICFLFSLIPYSSEGFNVGIIMLNLGALLFLYSISNKKIINGILLGMFFFLFMNFVFPQLYLFILLWVLLATTKMKQNYNDKIK